MKSEGIEEDWECEDTEEDTEALFQLLQLAMQGEIGKGVDRIWWIDEVIRRLLGPYSYGRFRGIYLERHEREWGEDEADVPEREEAA